MEQQIEQRIQSYFDSLVKSNSTHAIRVRTEGQNLSYSLLAGGWPVKSITLKTVLNITAMEAMGLRLTGSSVDQAERQVAGWLMRGLRDEAVNIGASVHDVSLLITNGATLNYQIENKNKIYKQINLARLITKYKQQA